MSGHRISQLVAHDHKHFGAELFQQAEDLRQAGAIDAAISTYRQALEVSPGMAEAHNNLAVLLSQQGDALGAIRHYRAAIALVGKHAGLYFNMAGALEAAGQAGEAIAAYRRAVDLAPDLVSAWNDLGRLLHATSDLDAAQASLEQALRLDSAHALAWANLATVLKDQGDVGAAHASALRAVQSDPGLYLGWSNLLFSLPYLSDTLAASDMAAIHAAFDAATGSQVAAHLPCRPVRASERLRIGYVSADFRDHAVTYFFEPALAHHDCRQVEVVCYDLGVADAVNERLRRTGTATWRDCAALDDHALAALIESDQIDVLVDLMGHTADNRLPVFVRRPAPIQVSWLGWPATTGLSVFDFVLADAHVDAGEAAPLRGPERVWPLPRTWLCYRPDATAPDVSLPPSLTGRAPTFGSFNGIYKITPRVVRVWAEILRQVPDGRLLIAGVPSDGAKRRLVELFGREAIAPDRLDLHAPVSLARFFELHAEVDVALDPFPFNGATTTLHTLWMGVPVVTLAGSTHAGRMGLGILRNLGLDDHVADDRAQYVALAVALAGAPTRLHALRLGMRTRMQASALLDEQGFVADLEAAFLGMRALIRSVET